MTEHVWRDESPPEKRAGRLITTVPVWKCSRCGLVQEVIPEYGADGQRLIQETDCDLVLVRHVLES